MREGVALVRTRQSQRRRRRHKSAEKGYDLEMERNKETVNSSVRPSTRPSPTCLCFASRGGAEVASWLSEHEGRRKRTVCNGISHAAHDRQRPKRGREAERGGWGGRVEVKTNELKLLNSYPTTKWYFGKGLDHQRPHRRFD